MDADAIPIAVSGRRVVVGLVVIAMLVFATLPRNQDAAAAAAVLEVRSIDTLALAQPTKPAVPPGDMVGAAIGEDVSLRAAKNEFESVRLRINGSGGQAVTDVSVDVVQPISNGTTTISNDNIRFYREDYYKVTRMSDGELSTEIPRDANGTCISSDCRIPDRLIPEKDTLYNEDRAAFPFNIPANENRLIWVDILVPQNATHGTYQGALAIRIGGVVHEVVPVLIQVANVAIPSTPTLASTMSIDRQTDLRFGANPKCKDAASNAQRWQCFRDYAVTGLNNRVALTPEAFPANIDSATQVMSDLLNGTASTQLAGAAIEDLALNQHQDFSFWYSLLGNLGKRDSAWFYCDEVTAHECVVTGYAGGQSYNQGKALFPGLSLMAIRSAFKGYPDPNTAGDIDGDLDTYGATLTISVPHDQATDAHTNGGVNPWGTPGPRMPAFDTWRSSTPGGERQREAWLYTACSSAGCGTSYTSHPGYIGWFGYGIDQPHSNHRAGGWQMFRLGVDGELYWQTAKNHNNSWDDCAGVPPANCLYQDGMNGDGSLFYDWNAAKVGGATPIPIESARLKRRRDGVEDYELLKKVADAGGGAAAQTLSEFMPTLYNSSVAPQTFADRRDDLMDLVDTYYPPGTSTTTTTSSSTTTTTTVPAAGDLYVPLTPTRLMDSRPGQSTYDGNFAGDGFLGPWEYGLQVGGRGGVPNGAEAAVLNMAVVGPTANGYATIYPCGVARPNASSLNFNAGETIPNEIVAKLPADGRVCIWASKNTKVIADVVGYMPAGSDYVPLTPTRLMDSRPGQSTYDGNFAGDGFLGPWEYGLQVGGRGGVPNGAEAAVLNVAVVGPTANGYATVYPCGVARPNASSLNFYAGETIPNEIVAKLPADGRVCIWASKNTKVIADVVGYMPAGSDYVPLTPTRLMDSRPGQSTYDGNFAGDGFLGPWEYGLQVGGRGGVPNGAEAAVLNVAVVGPTANGYATVYPCGVARPNASSLNFYAGETIPNEIVAKLPADGRVCIWASKNTKVIADVVGYTT